MRTELFPNKRDARNPWTELTQTIKAIPIFLRRKVIAFKGITGFAKLLKVFIQYRTTFAGQVERACLVVPDRTFIIDDFGTLTYNDVREQARRLASGLQRVYGITNKSTVAYLASNGRGMIIPQTAQGYVGWRMVLLNALAGAVSVRNSLRKVKCRVLISDPEFVPRLLEAGVQEDLQILVNEPMSEKEREEFRKAGVYSIHDVMAKAAPVGKEEFDFIPKQSNIVIMSSGTTADPKAIIVPQPKNPVVAAGILEQVPWESDITVSFPAKQFHAWGWGMTMIASALRCTLVCHREFDTEQIVEEFSKYNAKALVTSPIFIKYIVEYAEKNNIQLPKLDWIITAGNAWPSNLIRHALKHFGEDAIYSLYGSTELNQLAIATGHDLAKDPYIAGRPLRGTLVKVLREDGTPTDPNERGTIYGIHPLSALGFATDDGSIEVSTKFGMLSSGDCGFLDDEGVLHILGRGDSMIINGGENIHLNAVEDTILSLPGVEEAFVDADRSKTLNITPVAWVKRSEDEAGKNLTAEDVKKWVSNRMIAPAAPSDVIFVSDFERTSIGKVIHNVLPQWDRFQPQDDEAKSYKPASSNPSSAS